MIARIFYNYKSAKDAVSIIGKTKALKQNSAFLRNSDLIALMWNEDDDGSDGQHPKLIGSSDIAKDIAEQIGCDNEKIYQCLCADNPNLKQMIKTLRTKGQEFEGFAKGIEIRGQTDGACAILILRKTPVNYEVKGTDNCNYPVFTADISGHLIWGNKAFLKAVEMPNLGQAVKENARLDAKITDDIAKIKDNFSGSNIVDTNIVDTRAISIDGKRRMMRIFLSRFHDRIIGAAIDIEDEYDRNEILTREAKANVETLNQLTDAVAVFDANRELKTYNSAFAKLWGFEESFLDERPRHEEVLDRLRERSRLPHQRNYSEWRQNEMSHYRTTQSIPDETWSLPDGRILRVMRQRQPTGGLLVLYEDISDKTLLQAQYKTQLEVQRSTINRLREGIAVFSSDGRLSLANSAFLELWHLENNVLEDHKDFSTLVRHLKTLYSNEGFWDDLWARVCDPSPQGRIETGGEIERADGKHLNWLTRPLPDGATLVAFADVTAHHRIESLLREKALALTEADRLKTSFLEKVSYQLRTPLNTILGYSDLITSGFAGELNPVQSEQMTAIKQAGEQLETMVSHLLDLAIIDAGQASLDLGDVDVADAIHKIVETSTTKLSQTAINIKIECPDDIGFIRGDDKRFRQIIANLLNNAMRSANSGDEITIGAKRVGESLKLYIQAPNNANVGMFGNYDFDTFTEGSKRGGLGLVLVKKFVEMHGGWLAMDFANPAIIKITCHFPTVAKEQDANPELELF